MTQLPRGFDYLNGNGYEARDATALPTPTDQNGNLVNGTIYGQEIFGFWDDVANKITFVRKTDPADPTTFQIYTGYLFQTPPGNDLSYTLAGTFEAFAGTGATARATVYGWYATVTLIA